MDTTTSTNPTTTNLEGNAILQNEQGDVVAIVTDISKNVQSSDSNNTNSNQHILSTNSNQNASIIPPLIADTERENEKPQDPIKSEERNNLKIEENIVPALTIDSPTTNNQNQNTDPNMQCIPISNSNTDPTTSADMNTNSNTNNDGNIPPLVDSRWTKENRIVLKQLMCSLPPHDIGAALRVILDTFGVESSKLVRRGEFVELDLQHINDDYILDSLWNYCAQMQFNIQQIQNPQPIYYQQPMQQMHVQQPVYYPQSAPQGIYAPVQHQSIPNDPNQQYMQMMPPSINQNNNQSM